MSCCIIMKWFQTPELFCRSGKRRNSKRGGVLNPDYIAVCDRRLNLSRQFPVIYGKQCLQRRFEFVLLFSTNEILSLTQNLKTTRNQTSSLVAKQRFEAMNIPGC